MNRCFLLLAAALDFHGAIAPGILGAESQSPPGPASSVDWLIHPAPFVAKIIRSADGNEVTLSNGLVRRVPRLNPTAATRLTLQAAAVGWNYALETTTNLAGWAGLGTMPIGPGERASLLDTNAPGPQRFYRARLRP